jgi:hypothetical protein
LSRKDAPTVGGVNLRAQDPLPSGHARAPLFGNATDESG